LRRCFPCACVVGFPSSALAFGFDFGFRLQHFPSTSSSCKSVNSSHTQASPSSHLFLLKFFLALEGKLSNPTNTNHNHSPTQPTNQLPLSRRQFLFFFPFPPTRNDKSSIMSFQQYNDFAQQQQGGSSPTGGNAPAGQVVPQSGQPSASPAPYNNGAPPAGNGSAGDGSKTTLWMGELEPWIDENFVRNVWFQLGENVNVKMIRDKFSGNAGYCFVEFQTPAAAAKALGLNGTPIPNSSRPFKLNWASGGGLTDRRSDDRGPEYSIFVGDLGPEVNEYVLVSLFQSRFPSCKSAKIMTDPVSGMSRGYGFVRFSDEQDQHRALTEMQGVYCGNRPMRISTATPKSRTGASAAMPGAAGPMGMYTMGAPPMGYYGAPQPMNQFTDPNNTTVFVGGLSGYVTEDELRSFFQGFGEITYVKIPPGKGCGFVQFVQRHAAEMAINQMQGYPIGNSRVRLSWGRSQNNSGPAGTPYRPAPPPPVFPSMAMPPQHHYQSFAPLNPHASHMHPPPQLGQMPPPGPPGALQAPNDPTEPLDVQRMNNMYLAARDGQMDRLEADGRAYHSVYAA
jgi:RNA recognition motif-containing protein